MFCVVVWFVLERVESWSERGRESGKKRVKWRRPFFIFYFLIWKLNFKFPTGEREDRGDYVASGEWWSGIGDKIEIMGWLANVVPTLFWRLFWLFTRF